MYKAKSIDQSTFLAFIRFSLVGVAGFIVDSATLMIILWGNGDVYLGRLFSFFCAVTATWYLNRIFTFKDNDPRLFRQWTRFISTNAIGGLANYGIFALLISNFNFFNKFPLYAVAVGSLAGLTSNFTLSVKVAFNNMNNRPFLYRKKRHISIAIIMLCIIYVCSFGFYMKVFSNGFSGADESSHFINSYFIWDYLRLSNLTNPMDFAQQFYISYPKLSLGHWPPFYYLLVGILFFLFPATSITVVWINLLITAIVAAFIGHILKSIVGISWGLIGALIYLVTPITLEAMQFFMLDQPLTFIVLIAVFIWSRFTKRPSLSSSIYYGILAAIGIMTKGNGWLLGLFPLFHIIFTQKWSLLTNIRTYAGALLCFLIVFPWYIATAKISADGFNYSFGLDYAITALLSNLSILNQNIGIFGSLLVILAVFHYLNPKYKDDSERHGVALISISVILSVLTLQSVVPVDITNRYMMPALPFVIILAIFGVELLSDRVVVLWTGIKGFSNTKILLAALLFLPGLTDLFSSAPQMDLRMHEVAQKIIKKDSPQIIVIDGSPSGEGAFIAEALVTSEAKNLLTIRSSKILSDSNFMGTHYKLRINTLTDVANILQNINAQYIVLERSENGNFFPHNVIMEQYLNSPNSPYYKAFTFEHLYQHGWTYVYASKETLKPNFELAKQLNLPTKKLTL